MYYLVWNEQEGRFVCSIPKYHSLRNGPLFRKHDSLRPLLHDTARVIDIRFKVLLANSLPINTFVVRSKLNSGSQFSISDFLLQLGED